MEHIVNQVGHNNGVTQVSTLEQFMNSTMSIELRCIGGGGTWLNYIGCNL